MPWGEAIRLTRALLRDPGSWVYVALAGWEHPVSREFLVMAEHFDAFMRAHTDKRSRPERFPRPWPDESKKSFGKGTAIPIADLRRTLDEHRAAIEAARHSA